MRGDRLKCVFCGVVLHTQFGLGRTKGGHVSSGATARRDMEIVDVEENLQDIASIIGLTEDTDKNLQKAIGGIIGIAERLERGC